MGVSVRMRRRNLFVACLGKRLVLLEKALVSKRMHLVNWVALREPVSGAERAAGRPLHRGSQRVPVCDAVGAL